MTKFFLGLLVLTVSGCITKKSNDNEQAIMDVIALMPTANVMKCVKLATPMNINYFFCEDKLAYCYLGERGGISCKF